MSGILLYCSLPYCFLGQNSLNLKLVVLARLAGWSAGSRYLPALNPQDWGYRHT